MLNRKLSDYIFIGILLGILLVVLGVRSIALGTIDNKIAELDGSNVTLNKKITKLESLVEQNKNTQSDHLYDLYHRVPNYYSYNELYFNVLSQLYLVGINDTPEFNSEISIDDEKIILEIPGYDDIDSQFRVIGVELSFNVLDTDIIEALIDSLYNSEQEFLINTLEFSYPQEGEFVTVHMSFYAFYDVPEAN